MGLTEEAHGLFNILNHVITSGLSIRRLVGIAQSNAVEQFVAFSKRHSVEIRLG